MVLRNLVKVQGESVVKLVHNPSRTTGQTPNTFI
jgi:hypothetical protein